MQNAVIVYFCMCLGLTGWYFEWFSSRDLDFIPSPKLNKSYFHL